MPEVCLQSEDNELGNLILRKRKYDFSSFTVEYLN